MLSDYYYMFSAISIILMILLIYFSVIEMKKQDKTGRDYDATIFIIVPLGVIALIITSVLAYESWNIEVLFTDGVTISTEIITMGYFSVIWFFLFTSVCALMGKAIFEFFIHAFYEPKSKWER